MTHPWPGSRRYSYADYKPKPTVLYIDTEEEANEQVVKLRGPIGFDLEWPYDSRTEISGRVALVQLCDDNLILLIHVSQIQNFPQRVKELIESTEVAKVGVCIRGDGAKLFRDFNILGSNLVELGKLAHHIDANFATKFYHGPIVSLANLVKSYLNRDLPKDAAVRASQWDEKLNERQRDYRIGPPTLQQLTAYTLWNSGYGLLGICVNMQVGEKPLGDRQAIDYIMEALEGNPSLPFLMNDLDDLRQMHFDAFKKDSVNVERIKRWKTQGRGEKR
ncbi:ribonuclease H-like protein [Artomyces pyxidatus]|uniref:Ribonuclease H-like protein n=1 Tax=Artomyces pyxidatus TaxID=48021 RepID=A0ACB8T576_9AGAM|nr:ribonuclease H-like protein [Artomyces pyxidatus]